MPEEGTAGCRCSPKMCSSLPLHSWRGIQQKGPACGAQFLTSPKLYKHSRNADRPWCPEGVPGAWSRGAKTSNHEATTSAASSTAVLADRTAWPGRPCACWHGQDMAGGPRAGDGHTTLLHTWGHHLRHFSIHFCLHFCMFRQLKWCKK